MYNHYFIQLEKSIRDNWDKPALCNYHGSGYTHAELAACMAKFSLFFEKAGLQRGQKVALCARNTAQWAVAFLSLNSYGAVAVPILSDFIPESINHLVDHSDSVALFTDRDIWEKLDISKMPRLKIAINAEDFSLLYCSDPRIAALHAGIDEAFSARYPGGYKAEDFSMPGRDMEELALINYTSGTTSAPKGVMLSYRNLSASLDYAMRRVPVDNTDRIVSMLPLAHIYGLMYEFMYPLAGGATVYFLGKSPAPSLLLRAMKEIRPYLVVTVPLVMEKIYKSAIKPVLDKPAIKFAKSIPGISKAVYKRVRTALYEAFGGNVRLFGMGGAALSPEVDKCFWKMGLRYCVGYGMTEASPILGWSAWDEYTPGSCGKVVDCADVRIDSADPAHTVGEIQAKGDNIFVGYYKNEEATKAAFTDDGYLRTGDLGIIDKHRNIFIKGRSKSMILSANGQNIYPEELEAELNTQPYVVESVCVDRNGKIVALVYFDSDAMAKDGVKVEEMAENARTAANAVLPAYSQIASVEIQAEPFEKTPKMSIKRFLYK